MADPPSQAYFQQPTHFAHRRYEALRAVFVEGKRQKDVARQFGYAYGGFRQWVSEFRRMSDSQRQALFFATPPSVGPVRLRWKSMNRRLPIAES